MKRSGFSLLELVIAVGILSLLMTGIFEVAITTDAVTVETDAMADLEKDTLKIIERLSAELRNVSDDPESGFEMNQSSFTAALVTGWDYDANEPVYGEEVSWTLEYDGNEIDDGLDNDGDNLIDEMVLTRISEDGEEIICRNVGENGLIFTKNGQEIILSLTLVGYVWTTNSVISRTISPVTVALRN